MPENPVHYIEIVYLFLLLMVVALAALARWLRTPYPIVLVLAGLALSFVPGIPKVSLDPQVVFFVILPPLIYSAAWLTSWTAFSHHLVSIVSLAVGLVVFTVFGVAFGAPLVIPGFDWRSGLVLGSVVSTTDAIAATAVARRTGLPRRIGETLEGESLANDATGLLALQVAVGLVAGAGTPSAGTVAWRIALLAGGGLAVGLVLAVVVDWFERRIDDGPIEIAISILVPYAAYLAAETIHASGVLAVVAAGLYLSHRSTHFYSASVRLEAWAVWNSLTFIFNGLVFALIGLSLQEVLGGIKDYPLGTLVWWGVLLTIVVIALRLFWSFSATHMNYFLRRRFFRQKEQTPNGREIFLIGWTGMRGVIALAAALALPQTEPDGTPFPFRNVVVFLTFVVILLTLVVQGLTLPPVIRLLGLGGADTTQQEEDEARRIVLDAAISHLERARAADRPEHSRVYDDLIGHARERLEPFGDESPETAMRVRYQEAIRELLRVERDTALRLREEGKVSDEVLRRLERELDLTEARLRAP
ncbi:MAG: Na+/H+ antiporter [Myxococcales bacterium]